MDSHCTQLALFEEREISCAKRTRTNKSCFLEITGAAVGQEMGERCATAKKECQILLSNLSKRFILHCRFAFDTKSRGVTTSDDKTGKRPPKCGGVYQFCTSEELLLVSQVVGRCSTLILLS